MPTMRARGATRPLSDVSVVDVLSFGTGWQHRRRWPTRAAFVADYQAVRTAFLARYAGRTPFAELALRYRQAHGAAALEAADTMTIRAMFPE